MHARARAPARPRPCPRPCPRPLRAGRAPAAAVLAFSCLPLERLFPALKDVSAASKTITLYALGGTLAPLRAAGGALIISASAAASEELAFRGVLQTGALAVLTRCGAPAKYASAAAVAVQAGLFGLTHSYTNSATYLVTAAVAGVAFGAAFAATGSLLVPVIMHFVVDFVTFLLCHAQLCREGRDAQRQLIAADSPIANVLRAAFIEPPSKR